MTTTWAIQIDWDRNGNFTGDYDDITEYVVDANWFLGMRQPYKDYADDSRLELTLNNSDKRFSPENSSSPLYGKLASFRPVKITSHDGTTERAMWTGWIESIQPDVGQYGGRHLFFCRGREQIFCRELQAGDSGGQSDYLHRHPETGHRHRPRLGHRRLIQFA